MPGAGIEDQPEFSEPRQVREPARLLSFFDLDLESGGPEQSNFSRMRERLVETDIARR